MSRPTYSIKQAPGSYEEAGFDIWREDEDSEGPWIIANCYMELDANYIVAALKFFDKSRAAGLLDFKD